MAGPEDDAHDLHEFANFGWSKDELGNWRRSPLRGIGFEVRDYGSFGRTVYVAVYHSRGRPIPINMTFPTLELAKVELWMCYQSIK